MIAQEDQLVIPPIPQIFGLAKNRRSKPVYTKDILAADQANKLSTLESVTGVKATYIKRFLLGGPPIPFDEIMQLDFGQLISGFAFEEGNFSLRVLSEVFCGMPVLVYLRNNKLMEEQTFISIHYLLNQVPRSFRGLIVRPVYSTSNSIVYPRWIHGDPFRQRLELFLSRRLDTNKLFDVAKKIGLFPGPYTSDIDLIKKILDFVHSYGQQKKLQLIRLLRYMEADFADEVPEWM